MNAKPTPEDPDPNALNEEPEITQEESVPSDGRDEVGEEMMEQLGRERARHEKDAG